ncbi:hypothetical protein N9E49_05100 [Acidimicrobiia bacterium]|nr:hypothetical protein [Acidimicrobiia bacterium]
MVNQEIVVIGSSSELATEFIKLCLQKSKYVISISRSDNNQIKTDHHIQIQNYFNDYLMIKNEVRKLSNPTVIFFNGFLAENRNFQIPTKEEVVKTDEINFAIPYVLSHKLNNELDNINKFIYISTMAAIKPRYKNFIYGLSKNKLEESIKYLKPSCFLIMRYGKIRTKMSENHTDPPFTLSVNKAAEILYENLESKGIKFASFGLFLSGKLIELLPMKIVRKIKV